MHVKLLCRFKITTERIYIMRKLFIIGLVFALCACQQTITANTSNSSLNACLTQKAYASLNDGSIFTTELKTLAKNISSSCIQQLALQKAGLNEESVTAATSILNALKQAKTK